MIDELASVIALQCLDDYIILGFVIRKKRWSVVEVSDLLRRGNDHEKWE